MDEKLIKLIGEALAKGERVEVRKDNDGEVRVYTVKVKRLKSGD